MTGLPRPLLPLCIASVLEVISGRLQMHSFLKEWFIFSLCMCVCMCHVGKYVEDGRQPLGPFLSSHPPCIFETGLALAWIFSELVLSPPQCWGYTFVPCLFFKGVWRVWLRTSCLLKHLTAWANSLANTRVIPNWLTQGWHPIVWVQCNHCHWSSFCFFPVFILKNKNQKN